MKQTLLEMVQDILAAMDSDEVNSINDTAEAEQVARVIRGVYYDILSPADLPEQYDLFELEATSSSTPTVMTMPTDVISLDWIKYNYATTTETTPNFQEIQFMDLRQFFEMMYMLDNSESDVGSGTLTIDSDTINLVYYNDRFPKYYTTTNDYTVIFDSYNSDEDTNLQKTKTLCYGRLFPTFTLTDSFTPDLDTAQFRLLANEAKSVAFAELKQTAHAKAEQYSRRHWAALGKRKRILQGLTEFDKLPNYGRK